MLSILNEEAAGEMKPHYVSLCDMFTTILTAYSSSNGSNTRSCLYSLSSLKSMIPHIDESESAAVAALLPHAIRTSIQIVKSTSSSSSSNTSDSDEADITAVFDFFQTLVEYDIGFVSAHMATIGNIILEVVVDAGLKRVARVAALNLLGVMIESQAANLTKSDMIEPMVRALFWCMCEASDALLIKSDHAMQLLDDDHHHDHDEDGDDDDERRNWFTPATQCLDLCAIYLPAKRFMQTLIGIVSPALANADSGEPTKKAALTRRAALAALAITAEGCADYYREHHMQLVGDACLMGFSHSPQSDQRLAQCAFFATCQFSEHLQPAFSARVHARLMPLLVHNMAHVCELRSASRFTVRFFAALNAFCAALEADALETYAATLMSALMTLEVQSGSSLKMKRLLVSAFAAMTSALGARFDAYFDYVVELMKPYLVLSHISQASSDLKLLQIQCIDMMGIFAKHISAHKFNDKVVQNCLNFVQDLLTTTSSAAPALVTTTNGDAKSRHNASVIADPDVRSAAYDLLGGLVAKLRERLTLNIFMPQLIETLRSDEGIHVSFFIFSPQQKSRKLKNVFVGTQILENGEVKDTMSPFDEIDLSDEDEEEEDDDDDDEEDEAFDEDETGDEGGEDVLARLSKSCRRVAAQDEDDMQQVVADNEYISEKLAALYCLQEICKYKNVQLVDYFADTLAELRQMSLMQHVEIRKEAFSATAALVSYYYEFAVADATHSAAMTNRDLAIKSKLFCS